MPDATIGHADELLVAAAVLLLTTSQARDVSAAQPARPPRKVLLASLAVATMDPIGLLVARSRGLELPPLGLLIWTYLPNYICAGLAVLPSHIIHRLGRKVRQARELGSYRLVERIGRGGMGEVWKAEHSMLARPAAIAIAISAR